MGLESRNTLSIGLRHFGEAHRERLSQRRENGIIKKKIQLNKPKREHRDAIGIHWPARLNNN